MTRLFLCALAVFFTSTAAAEVAIQGSIRSRLEAWDWYEGAGDNAYVFSGNILRLSLSEQRTRWDWQVEFAAPFLLGLPEGAVAPAPQLQLGFGGNYFAANSSSRNAGMIFPKQAFIRLKNVFSTGDSLRFGRFEFADGAETVPKNVTLAALKRDRIAQRLLGPFGFSHVGRSFDGAQYSWTQGALNVTAIGAVPTRGVFQVDGWGNMPVALAYGAITEEVSGDSHDGEWRAFGMYYDDARDVLKTDNRPAAQRALDFDNVRIGTFGGHYIHEARSPEGSFDAVVWAAVQTGHWGRLDHRAWSLAVEGGWQPPSLPQVRPWLRGGYFQSSGDDNPFDSEHSTFFQVLPTPRVYSRFPFYNLMNLRDAFGSLILRPNKLVTLRTDLHGLWLANRNDLWYQGGGAFQPWSFGYIGRPSFAQTGLATLWDISGDWQAAPSLLLSGYFAHAAGGGVIESVYPSGSSANLGYLEVTYRF